MGRKSRVSGAREKVGRESVGRESGARERSEGARESRVNGRKRVG